MTVADRTGNRLACALSRIAACPGQTRHLHDVLGRYCHKSRNLLNSLKMSLYLASRATDPKAAAACNDLQPLYLDVERFFDRLQQLCRPLPINLVRLPLSLLFDERRRDWTETLDARGRRLVLKAPCKPPAGDFDPARLRQGLDDLVAWRAREGPPGTDLRVAWKAEGGAFLVVWDEPAPGAPPSRSSLPSSMSERRSTPAGGGEGADALALLAVPLLTRIMALHGGTVTVTEVPRWRLSLSWPLDVHPTLTPRDTS